MKFKSYFLLLISALVFFVISFCVSKQDSFTLNIKDTYYVMPKPDFYYGIAILCFTSGLVYFVLDKSNVKLISILSKAHVYVTLLSIFLLLFFNYKNNLDVKSVRFGDIINQFDYNSCVGISLIVILFLQFLFLINIFVSQIKKMRSHQIS
jgi:heme/copper-type cytochrome/quinol oxidase subunit 1